MDRRLATVSLCALATGVLGGLWWLLGTAGGGVVSIDLPLVSAGEIEGSYAPEASELSRPRIQPAESPTVTTPGAARRSERNAAAPAARTAIVKPGESSDGTESPSALILVRTREAASGEAAANVRVAAYVPGEAHMSRPVAGNHGDLVRRPRSDRAGVVELLVPVDREIRLVATGPEVGAKSFSKSVPPLRMGETREINLTVEAPSTQLMELSILEPGGEVPIGDAEVHLDTPASVPGEARAWGGQTTPLARADGAGELLLDRDRLGDSRLRILAPGRAPVTLDLAGLSDRHTFELELDAALDVHVGAVGLVESRPIVRVLAKASSLSLTHPFGEEPPPFEWTAEVNEAGTASFDGLPPGTPLILEIEVDGVLHHRAPKPLVLEPDERVGRILDLGDGTHLHGVLLDSLDRPAEGIDIWVVPAEARGASFLCGPQIARRVTASTRTGRDGSFHLHGIPAGEWLVGPAPPTGRADERTLAPLARWIRLPEAGGDIRLDLRVDRGLYLEGRVSGTELGLPARGVVVEARLIGTGAIMTATCGSDGRFKIGPVSRATYELHARPVADNLHSGSRAILATPGNEVELDLLPGRTLVVHALDPSGNPGALQHVRWTRCDVGPFAIGEHVSIEPVPSVVVAGLDEGTYDVYARSSDGRVGLARDVRVTEGGRPRDVRVELGASSNLVIENAGNAEVRFEVFLGSCSVYSGKLGPAARSTVSTPPGELSISCEMDEKPKSQHQLTLDPGQEGRIVLAGPTSR